MWEHFEFVYKIFLGSSHSIKFGQTYKGFAAFLGMSNGKIQKWRELRQWPKAHDLKILHEKLGFTYGWLVTGEGAPFEVDITPALPVEEKRAENLVCIDITPSTQTSGSVPLVGFASCGIGGWLGTMTIPVPVEPPSWHEGMVAVMASGESMLPAGIGHGHVCYCDTYKKACRGEAVFVRQKDGRGTLKLFLGKSAKGRSRRDFFDFRGWLDKKPERETQKPFTLSVPVDYVENIAPVIYVRRRL